MSGVFVTDGARRVVNRGVDTKLDRDLMPRTYQPLLFEMREGTLPDAIIVRGGYIVDFGREGDKETTGDNGDDKYWCGIIPHLLHPPHLLYHHISPFSAQTTLKRGLWEGK